jgi:phosphatidylinositol-3-phosphatase
MKRILLFCLFFCFLLAACGTPMPTSAPVVITPPTFTAQATLAPSREQTRPSVPLSTLTPTPTSSDKATRTVTPTAKPTRTPTLQPTPRSKGATPTLVGTTDNRFTGMVPNFEHIVMIVLENHDYEEIIGNPNMPNLNALAKKFVLMTNNYAIRHPSLPNYIALMSGDTQGITKDCNDCFVDATNLADVIEASGRTWKAYIESMPSPCYVGNTKLYAMRHNPLIYFDSVRLNPERCQANDVPLPQLDADLANNVLPNFSFIMPDMCNSGHDCSLEVTDRWVGNMVSKLQSSDALGGNSLIIVTFDEGNDKNTASCCGLANKAGGRIATVLISPQAKPGFTDGTPISHYGLLKTILTAWKLPDLGKTSASETQPIIAPWQK